MKKIILLFAVLIGTVVFLCSCCKHENCTEATCAIPSTCLNCGKAVSATLDHTSTGRWIVDKEATCTEEGSRHQICSVCKTTIETQKLEKLDHANGRWIVDKEATCTEDGSRHQICSVCKATIKSEAVAKLNHPDGEWITDKEATCTEDGSRHQICSLCKVTINSETVAKLGHTDGKWITDKEATCAEDGSRHQICSLCKVTIKTEIIPNSGEHIYQKANVENNGIVGSKITYVCASCSDTYEKIVEDIVVSVNLSGTSFVTFNGYGAFSKSYSVSASGGYGDYLYKFEVYTSSSATQPTSSLTKDFSNDNSYSITYRGNEDEISGYVLQVTVKDDASNMTVYRYEL